MTKKFSDLIKERITATGYTTKQIATACNVSVSMVERWKSGKTYPAVQHLWRLTKLLHTYPELTQHVTKSCFFEYVKIIDDERK